MTTQERKRKALKAWYDLKVNATGHFNYVEIIHEADSSMRFMVNFIMICHVIIYSTWSKEESEFIIMLTALSWLIVGQVLVSIVTNSREEIHLHQEIGVSYNRLANKISLFYLSDDPSVFTKEDELDLYNERAVIELKNVMPFSSDMHAFASAQVLQKKGFDYANILSSPSYHCGHRWFDKDNNLLNINYIRQKNIQFKKELLESLV